MPDSKITALASIGTGTDPAVDPLVIVDVSDTSMAASGTTKKVTLNQLLATSPTATLASATITGDLTVRTTGLVVNSTGTGVQVSPSAPLCVKTRNSDSVGLRVLQSTGGTAGIQFTDDPVTADWGSILATSANLVLRSNSLLQLQTGGATERFAISSTGVCTWSNVGGVAGTAMTLNSTGLGLGVTPSAWNTGYKAIELGSNVGSFSATTGIFDSALNAYFNTSSQWIYKTTAAATLYRQQTGQHQWFRSTDVTPTAGNAITFTLAMTLDASGRLLIGSSSSGTAAGDGVVKLGTYGHCISQTGTSIASGSSVDLTVITSGAGYQGFLSVAVTQDASANTRTQTTYSVFGRGTTSTITQIATANGSIGGASFTVTTPSNGVIRITNTSGAAATISAQFFGGASL